MFLSVKQSPGENQTLVLKEDMGRVGKAMQAQQKKRKTRGITLFTYEQLEIAFLKQGNCRGNNS